MEVCFQGVLGLCLLWNYSVSIVTEFLMTENTCHDIYKLPRVCILCYVHNGKCYLGNNLANNPKLQLDEQGFPDLKFQFNGLLFNFCMKYLAMHHAKHVASLVSMHSCKGITKLY